MTVALCARRSYFGRSAYINQVVHSSTPNCFFAFIQLSRRSTESCQYLQSRLPVFPFCSAMFLRIVLLLVVVCGLVASKELADGCGMNPLLALVAVADKTGQSVETLMGKFSNDKIAFREFVTLLGRYESCIRVGSGTRYKRSALYPWNSAPDYMWL